MFKRKENHGLHIYFHFSDLLAHVFLKFKGFILIVEAVYLLLPTNANVAVHICIFTASLYHYSANLLMG